ncbi:hypothetical protein [Pseudorhodobacter sp. MZDSW-24AT]|uniref:hypothetical protein n=1 Tax=Pseudorhodobacter sp. MZDSW-24AT TaxID=2052957 RepID=UPI000C1F2452|nr:hypothetical protein [Pseudorhodobacter sp. MZDSW-24AT]PJF08393.1 hypothetical protein CUR21_15130 [Pseudorhodobacter sp. MZDSW-24AT]
MSYPSTLAVLGLTVALGLGVGAAPVAVAPGWAQSGAEQAAPAVDPARISALTETLRMGDVFAVMREEGLAYGRTLAAEMFADDGGPQWDSAVSLIYDADTMRSRFEAALTEALAGAGGNLSAIEGFFGSAQGQAILQLEVEARRALLETEIEDAAKLAWEDLQAEGGARVEKLTRFAATNDLIESNVMGALNANLAFYRGLSENGGFPQPMSEDDMLADVWGQEPDVRAETEDWLFPYLMLAYQPLAEEDLDAYIAFSETAAGKTLNAALFSAFDKVFTQISYDLGRAAAGQMQGQDI